MRQLAFSLACLACACRAWRVHTSSRQLKRDQRAASQTQLESVKVRQSSSPTEAFLMFLLALNPRAAFRHCGPRAPFLLGETTSALSCSGVASGVVQRRCCCPCMESWSLQERFPGEEGPSIVNGYEVVPRASAFPDSLEAPSTYETIKRLPLPSILSTIYAPLNGEDLLSALFVGIALMFGPDAFLAWAGIASGLRPRLELEAVVGELVTPDDQWLKDRKEGLKAEVPLQVQAIVLLPFLAAGVLVSRLLLVAVEDQTFVTSLGIIGCISGAAFDVIRDPLPTREERDRQAKLLVEFIDFANERLQLGGQCKENDIVEVFRRFYPRYRWSDMGSTTDGVSLTDREIQRLLRRWNKEMGYPGFRKGAQAGYWDGISLKPIKGVLTPEEERARRQEQILRQLKDSQLRKKQQLE
mmetsp:Transcript_69268/g.130613  ORF Transcript_69268/g.130613 Transcript_69268/m.130613 type:complete len:413 (-) Transcript_69268:53-1291(-)